MAEGYDYVPVCGPLLRARAADETHGENGYPPARRPAPAQVL